LRLSPCMKDSLGTVFGTHMVQFPEEIQRA
jgi:hypothetical protein